MISNSVTPLWSYTNTAITGNSVLISPGLCTDIAKNSACAPISQRQSAEYDKRVANTSLFIYIGSPGLHRNSYQAPGSSRHSALASHRFAYIYNIYRLPVHNFIFSIKCTSLFFDIFWRQISDQSPRGVGPHPINFFSTIHYKLCHAGQQYFWIKLNSALLQDLLWRCHSVALKAEQPVLPDVLENVL